MSTVCEHDWSPYDRVPDDPGHGHGDQFVYCSTCGVVRTASMQPPSAPIYDSRDYFTSPGSSFFTDDGIPRNDDYSHSRLEALLPGGFDRPRGDRQLLYLGPGMGQLVSQFLAWGWDVECCEVGDWPSRYLRGTYPMVRVFQTDWEIWSPNHRYDAIVGNHVLEHFRGADRAFEKAVDYLRPGGKLYFEVPIALYDDGAPNLEGWAPILGFHNHDHWWHFNRRALLAWSGGVGLTQAVVRDTVCREDGRRLDHHLTAVKP